MDRFEQLYAIHYDARFKTYEMLAMNEKHWLFNWVGPSMMLNGFETLNKVVKDKDVLDEKLKEKDE